MSENTGVALVTGAAHRLGAATARALHARDYRVVVHYRSRQHDADALVAELNELRPGSAVSLQADLADPEEIQRLARQATDYWSRLDVLVNNASVFFPTPTGELRLDDWDRLVNTNLRAPVLLVEHLVEELKLQGGCIVNLIDIYSERPLVDHPVYSATKAALASLTRSWARDLAPEIRTNGVSPGAVLWPENDAEPDSESKKALLQKVPMHRTGEAGDIAGAVTWLVCDAPYVNGQIISVDGGRSISM
ncbi:pteridine reductase [Halospina denitrificans]|uniref:Pteridine reductase n=1 Tax=Halospina denitrificans TaxID=332522 RepID=A0A4R7JY51_9GAMM|nr:pteridine reductase [Halospina denitrificans]TDT43430.1 pteridine reductase [Halospina denitrificans]